MLGTAGLPHLLTRYYTAPSVAGARSSVAWSLFFIALLYLSAPALAALVKYEVMHKLVGVRFDELPTWIAQWSRVDSSLLAVEDVNGDGRLQWGEIRLGADLIMLATPEIAGLPYVMSGLVAAGGLAAALSTADGLLLTISNALVRDLYFQARPHQASTEQRVIVSKFVLMAVALAAAFVATRRSSDILPMVGSFIFDSCLRPCAGDGAGHFLAWHQPHGCGGRHAQWAGGDAVLHALPYGTGAGAVPESLVGQWDVVGHPAGVGRRVWRAGGFGGGDSGQLLEKTLATRLGLPRRLGNLLEGGGAIGHQGPQVQQALGVQKRGALLRRTGCA